MYIFSQLRNLTVFGLGDVDLSSDFVYPREILFTRPRERLFTQEKNNPLPGYDSTGDFLSSDQLKPVCNWL